MADETELAARTLHRHRGEGNERDHLLHKLRDVDAAEVVDWIMSCYHPESGTTPKPFALLSSIGSMSASHSHR
jgi:hypothetical protein